MEDNGHIALAVINRHKDIDIETKIHIKGFEPKRDCKIRVLNASEVTTANDFDEPDNVKIETTEFEKAGKNFIYTFPAHSVTIIELEPISEVIPYSFGSDRKSEIFKASVNQVDIPVTVVPDVSPEQAVYIVEQYKTLPEYCWIESRYVTAHYLHFASDETARITLTLNEPVHDVTVYPKRFNAELQIDGNSLSFSINQNSSNFYIVSVNDLPMVVVLAESLEKEGADHEGSDMVPLTRFVKAAGLEPDYSEVFKRAITYVNGTGKTLVIPAGEYLTDAIKIIDCSDFNIYFEPGSLIRTRTSPPGENIQNEGILIRNSRNIRIYGNGCLDHQAYENFSDGINDYHHGFPGYDYYFKFEDIPSNSIYLQSPLMLIYSQNISIEGLLIRNGRNYNINSRHCDNITLRNVKVITPAGSVPENTDGINIGSYRNFLIENSFVFCNDDAFAMGHNLLPYDNRPEQHLVIRNFMGWNPRANAIRLGWASNTHNGDMLFYNCDFCGMDDCSMQLHSHSSTRNEFQDSLCYGTVRFENCTFDDVDRYTRQMIDVQNACMESLEFVNVAFDANPEFRSTIYGDAERKIGSLIIDNMTIGGQKVTKENFDFDTKNIDNIIIR